MLFRRRGSSVVVQAGWPPGSLVRHQAPDARHPVGLGAFQLPGEPFRFCIALGFGDELQKQIPRGPCSAFCPLPRSEPHLGPRLA